jgi:protocatechuate 3,4-dioxygenase alpha subunit
MTRIITPSHTCGPLFGFAIMYDGLARATDASDPEAIFLSGTVRDSVNDLGFEGFLEICAPGQMVRVRTHAGRYEALLKRPAPEVLTGAGPQAPHFTILVHARGVTRHLMTRAYLPGHEAAFATDPVVGLVPAADRAALLMQPGTDARHFSFDICLQGESESVFFDL